MTDSFTPMMRALVAATLLLATAAMMIVVVSNARAAGALAVGRCGAFGESFDFRSADAAREIALSRCTGQTCRVVASVRRGCAALAVDFVNPCASHGWGKGSELGHAQNAALKSCYRTGGKECVIRTFFCDAKG
jgi:hypothetical protein